MRDGANSIPFNFVSKGHHYHVDEYGVHQTNPQPFTYDTAYAATYDKPEYKLGSETLNALRLGFIIGTYGKVPQSICDVGYGNGDFLRMCKGVIPKLMGKDVSGVTLDWIEQVWSYAPCDVVTFHDVLEHIQDLSFLNDIPCKMIVVSCPYCHLHERGLEWFDKFKHHKPDEHVHYWNKKTLSRVMFKYGWDEVATSTHEDKVRVGADSPNILSMAFKRGYRGGFDPS